MKEISIRAEELFQIGSFPVTNSLLLSFVSLLVLLSIGLLLRKNIALVPGKLQTIFEVFIEQMLVLMDSVLGARKLSEKYLPLVATIFLFIVTSNWLGLFPFVGPIGIYHHTEYGEVLVPLFRSPASDLNFTVALGMIAMFGVNFLALIALGVRRHMSKFFTLKNPIFSFVGILEFMSEFVKIISFSFRLFGNVFAGEVLLIIVGSLIPYVVPLPFMFLELFVGFIQAFIFSMLTLVFMAMAVSHEEAH